MTERDRLRIAILFGGRSGEHEVSVASARSVLSALDPERFEAVPIAITRAGAWLSVEQTRAALASFGEEMLASVPEWCDGAGVLAHPEALELLRGVDVAFPVLHGTQGEDGAIQGLFELAGIPYAGCGVAASALGMDKSLHKALWREAGLPVVESVTVRAATVEQDLTEAAKMVEARFGYPVFVKPANGGSSVGVSRAASREDLTDAFTEAGRWDRKIIVERAVAGREIECAVLGNDEPVASPLGEIVLAGDLYSYESKYVDDTAGLVAPADLSEETTGEIQRLALAAYRALDCAGMARVDFFLPADGRPVLNEINTIPGFTRISMYPRLWAVAGLAYPDLLARLIELGLERYAQTRR